MRPSRLSTAVLLIPFVVSGCALDNSAAIERRRRDDELTARLDRIEGDLRRVQAGFQSVERSVNEAQDAAAQAGQRMAKLEKRMDETDEMMAMEEPGADHPAAAAPAHHPAHAAAVKDKPKPEEGEAGDITRIQAALAKAGYNPGTPDGKMGRKTKEALMKFQKDNGIKADGVVGPQTLAKLQPYLVAGAAPAPEPAPAP